MRFDRLTALRLSMAEGALSIICFVSYMSPYLQSKHLGGAVDKPHHGHAVKVVYDIEAAVCLVKAREMS